MNTVHTDNNNQQRRYLKRGAPSMLVLYLVSVWFGGGVSNRCYTYPTTHILKYHYISVDYQPFNHLEYKFSYTGYSSMIIASHSNHLNPKTLVELLKNNKMLHINTLSKKHEVSTPCNSGILDVKKHKIISSKVFRFKKWEGYECRKYN